MEVRIEVRAERFDRLHAALAQDLEQLTVDELDAAAIGVRAVSAGLGLQRALEIVDERQQIANDVAVTASAMLCRSRSTRLR